MGGVGSVPDTVWTAFEEGDYRWAATVLNHLDFADTSNQTAKEMLASTYEQLGFQAGYIIWRNIYLCGARELREGVEPRIGFGGVNEDIVRAMPIGDVFNLLAVKLDPAKAKDVNQVINFDLTDSSEKIVVIVNNQVENNKVDAWNDQADLTV